MTGIEKDNKNPIGFKQNFSWLKLMFYAALGLIALIDILRWNYLYQEGFYFQTPDGDLYLSIADNMIQNGHFVETISGDGAVYPFGLPFICLVIKLIFGTEARGIYVILMVQYILYGATVLMIARTAEKISGNILGALAAFYIFRYLQRIIQFPNPAAILTETYTAFFITGILFIWICMDIWTKEKKLEISVILSFVSTCIRPVMMICIILFGAPLSYLVFQKKYSIRRFCIIILTFSVVLLTNTLVNYREIGHYVMMENYGGRLSYIANNPNTSIASYASSLTSDFTDQRYKDIANDASLDTTEANETYKKEASQFIRTHIRLVLRNTIIKYSQLYNIRNAYNIYVFGLSLIILLTTGHFSLHKAAVILLLFIACTIIPSFGLYIPRYGMPCILFYSIILASVIGTLWNKLAAWIKAVIRIESRRIP